MAKYRVMEKSFINNTIVEEGAIIEYEGEAGPNLQLVKGKQKSDKAESSEVDENPGDEPA